MLITQFGVVGHWEARSFACELCRDQILVSSILFLFFADIFFGDVSIRKDVKNSNLRRKIKCIQKNLNNSGAYVGQITSLTNFFAEILLFSSENLRRLCGCSFDAFPK